ncbi:MAG TPA: zf-HC2 domain-containing protein, partial [Thermoanaerobaculia bacterium]
MNPMEHSAFPSDETLAAFIDGRLDEETRKRVVAHVADCEDCYGTVMAGRAFQSAKKKPVIVSHPRSPKALWISSGSIAAAAVIALVIFAAPMQEWYSQYSYSRRTHIGTLLDAANHLPFRASEARLSGQSVYRPAEPTKRGVSEELHPLRLLAAASAVEDATQSAPAIIRLHAAGVSSLLLGRVDDAVRQLDRAIQLNRDDSSVASAIHLCKDARLLNDAAAAHYTRFKMRASAEDLLISNEAVTCAWKLHPDSATAWNRALILQAMQAHAAAVDAWREYLALDGTSSWSREAQGRLNELTTPVRPSALVFEPSQTRQLALSGNHDELVAAAKTWPQYIRAFCEEEVLPAWARSFHSHDKVAARENLSVARAVASAIRDATLDDLDIDSVLIIESEQSSQRGLALSEAISAFADGRLLSRQHRTSEALAKLKSAAAALRSLSCPLWLRSQVYIGTADYYLGAYAQSADAIRQLREALGSSTERYPSVSAQAEWIRGLIETTANHPYEAERAYRLAADQFEATGERDNAAFVQMLSSEAMTLTGNSAGAWTSALRALSNGYGYSTSRHFALMNVAVGRAALAANYTASAEEYARAALDHDLRRMDPPFAADALMLRGAALEQTGAAARADLCLNAAAQIAHQLPDEALRNRM